VKPIGKGESLILAGSKGFMFHISDVSLNELLTKMMQEGDE
jgi:hypothetical protein